MTLSIEEAKVDLPMVAMAATRVGMVSPPMVTRAATVAVVAMVEVHLPMVVLAVATGAELHSREAVLAETLMIEPFLSGTSDSVLRSPRFPMSSEEIG
jgi:hypothetical protein